MNPSPTTRTKSYPLQSLDDYLFETMDRSEEQVQEEIAKIITQLFNHTKLKITRQTGGNTNRLYKIDLWIGEEELSVLLRINGLETEKIINRERELAHMIQLDKHNVGAKIYAIFKNGFVYEYVEGKPIETSLELIQNLKEIGEKLAKWHLMKIESDITTPSLFHILYKWIEQLKNLNHEPNGGNNDSVKEEFNLERIENEVKHIENEHFKNSLVMINANDKNTLNPFSIGFCHNDLVSLNIIASRGGKEEEHFLSSNNQSEKEKGNGEREQTIHFIDCEYCSYNYIGFDIGNFFNEFCGFQMDKSLYPSKKVQREFIQHYLGSMLKQELSLNFIDNFLKSIPVFSKLSHLFWGLWARCQAHYSNLEFDYIGYSNGRFSWYFEE